MSDEDKFIEACKNNDIITIKKLVNKGINIHTGNEYGFRIACSKGHINVVRFLTLLYQDKNHFSKNYKIINIHIKDEEGFRYACYEGHIHVVIYLTLLYRNSKNYKMIDIHARNEDGFICACYKGHIEVVRYLTLLYLDINPFGENYKMINIHIYNEEGFKFACSEGNIEVARYLIKLYKKTKYTPINIYNKSDYGDCMRGFYSIKYIANLGNYKEELLNKFI